MSDTTKSTRAKSGDGITAEERAAMKELARERRSKATRDEQEAEVLAKIADMPPADRALAEKVHAIIREAAPELAPKTWYGMPAYARDGKPLVFFQDAAKFKARYATLGFQDTAALDDGTMWPTSFALTEITPAVEKRIVELVRRAVA